MTDLERKIIEHVAAGDAVATLRCWESMLPCDLYESPWFGSIEGREVETDDRLGEKTSSYDVIHDPWGNTETKVIGSEKKEDMERAVWVLDDYWREPRKDEAERFYRLGYLPAKEAKGD